MELDLKKSFFIQHWEFIVLFITIVFFFSKLRANSAKSNDRKGSPQQVNDDEVIASDYQNDEINDVEEDEGLTPALEDEVHVPYKGVQKKLNGGADEFFEMVNDRRSIRMISSQPVDIEIVKTCIKAAGTSPSGAHTEPWTYCLIKELVKLFTLPPSHLSLSANKSISFSVLK